MAGNLLQVGNADGKVRVKSNGVVVAGASDPCCCAVACPACDALLSTTPSSIAVTISGVSICSSCTTPPSGGDPFKTFFDPNGTYTLTRASTELCAWNRNTTEATPVIRSYTSGTCATQWNSSTALFMRLVISGTTWTFEIYNNMSLTVSGVGVLFHGTATAVDCSSPFDITNANTACGANEGVAFIGDLIVAATGGTASFTP